jgi:hypothetical protein
MCDPHSHSNSPPREPTPLERFERALISLPPVHCALVHTFTPGLYIRQATIPAEAVLTTMISRADYPLFIMRGELEIITGEVIERISAPHLRVSKAGDKMVIHTLTEVEMVGVFANPDDETDPDEIGRSILEPLDNPLIHDDDPNANMWRSDRQAFVKNPDKLHDPSNRQFPATSRIHAR